MRSQPIPQFGAKNTKIQKPVKETGPTESPSGKVAPRHLRLLLSSLLTLGMANFGVSGCGTRPEIEIRLETETERSRADWEFYLGFRWKF